MHMWRSIDSSFPNDDLPVGTATRLSTNLVEQPVSQMTIYLLVEQPDSH